MGWSKLNIEAPKIEQNLELSVGSNDLMISNLCQNLSWRSPLKTKYLSVQSVHELSPIVSTCKTKLVRFGIMPLSTQLFKVAHYQSFFTESENGTYQKITKSSWISCVEKFWNDKHWSYFSGESYAHHATKNLHCKCQKTNIYIKIVYRWVLLQLLAQRLDWSPLSRSGLSHCESFSSPPRRSRLAPWW